MELRRSELFRGSIILLVLLNIVFFLNALFRIISARMLGPADYGLFATLMSMIFILGTPSEALQTIISRYTTRFYNKDDKIKGIFVKTIKITFMASLACVLGIILLAPFIGSMLDIDYKLIILISFSMFGFFLLPSTRGIMQGKKRFFSLGFSLIIESTIKVIFAIIFIGIGFKVYGAVGALLFSLFIAFLVSLLFIKDVLSVKADKSHIEGIYDYSWLVFWSTFCIVLFYSVDVILAKRFFSSEDVGMYAAISDMGKMIFWGTAPISKAMLPIISEKQDNKTSSRGDIKKSLLLVICVCLAGLLIFALFPDLVLRIFFGSQYLKFSSLLVYFGISMLFLAITNIFVYQLISQGSKKSLFLIFFVILQIGLLLLYHQSVSQFIIVLIISNFITALFFSLLYFTKRKS